MEKSHQNKLQKCNLMRKITCLLVTELLSWSLFEPPQLAFTSFFLLLKNLSNYCTHAHFSLSMRRDAIVSSMAEKHQQTVQKDFQRVNLDVSYLHVVAFMTLR